MGSLETAGPQPRRRHHRTPSKGTMVSMRYFWAALLLSVTLEKSLASNGATDSTSGTVALKKQAMNFRRLNSTNSTNSSTTTSSGTKKASTSDAHATAVLSSAAVLTVIASMRAA